MNTELSNGPAKAGGAQRAEPLRLDRASIRDWLGTRVAVVVPRWGLVSLGLAVAGLLLIALD